MKQSDEIVNPKNYSSKLYPKLSDHARERMIERGLSYDEILVAIFFGDSCKLNYGRTKYFFSDETIKKFGCLSPLRKMKKLNKIVVIVKRNIVITVYDQQMNFKHLNILGEKNFN